MTHYSDDELTVLQQLRQTPRLFDAIASRDVSESEFHLQQRLRRDFPDQLVRTALTLHDLRQKGATKFSRAAEMWFTPTGLEQATAEPVSRHKARRFEGQVWDFCCGIGGDTLALANHCDVRAVDLDPSMCIRTEWNSEIYGVANRVESLCTDVTTIEADNHLLHIDPDRRPGGNRVLRIEDCSPDLEVLQRLIHSFRGGAIKLSPASNFVGKFANAEIELVSLHGECKEATVWFGELAGSVSFRATSLPSGETIAGDPLSALAEVTTPQEYLFDPDPAIVRSGLLDVLAEKFELTRLDASEEYLTGPALIESPWLQRFRILDILPNNEREFRAACRRHDFGTVEIKCRHLPVAIDRLRKKLPLEGTRSGVLIFARLQGKAQVIIAERPMKQAGF